jgi:Lon protease-like protein
VENLGLFPLGIVLLPTERVPLHIFEPRYKELIGECLEDGHEFGLVYADESGVRDVGTRARVIDLLEELDDGRMNVIIEGGERFRLLELTSGRSFHTGRVEPVDDEPEEAAAQDAKVALGAFRALAKIVEAEPDVPEPDSPSLSFELAARVELPAGPKQRLLELRSERERLQLVAELLDETGRRAAMERELAERASRNGSRSSER